MKNPIKNDIMNVGQYSTDTLTDFHEKSVATVPSCQSLVGQNLRSLDKYTNKNRALFMERIMEHSGDLGLQALLSFRRLNCFFSKCIDEYLTQLLDHIYLPEVYTCEKFQILKHENRSEVPQCLRSNRIVAAFDDNKPQISVLLNNNSCKFSFDVSTTLQQSLIFYFHAKRQLIENPRNLACKVFAETFETHLKSFKSLCQSGGFQCYIPTGVKSIKWRNGIQEWLIIPFDNSVQNNILLHLDSPYSAYLFLNFLQACASNQGVFQILQKPWGGGFEARVLLFFLKYSQYSTVSTLLSNFINACNQGLTNNNLHVHLNSLCYLMNFAQRGWLNKACVKNINLFEKTLNLAFHNNGQMRVMAFNILYILVNKDLIDKSLIEKLKLREIVIDKIFLATISRNSNDNYLVMEGFSSMLFLLLIDKNYFDDALLAEYNLISKVMLAYKNLIQPGEKLASLKAIKNQLMHGIDICLKEVIIPKSGLKELCSLRGILFQLAKNNLIYPSIIKIIEEQKLDVLPPSTEKELYQVALDFIKIVLKSTPLIRSRERK